MDRQDYIRQMADDIIEYVKDNDIELFDEDGILTEIIEKVDTKNHAEQILG